MTDEDDQEDDVCSWCSGSGEGMWDGATCTHCHGTGAEPVDKVEEDLCYDLPDENDERD